MIDEPYNSDTGLDNVNVSAAEKLFFFITSPPWPMSLICKRSSVTKGKTKFDAPDEKI